MAAAAPATETFAERMRKLANEARSGKKDNQEEWRQQKTEADYLKFFNSIKTDAMQKIEKRAKLGANSANLLEYSYDEHFYVSKNGGTIVHCPEFQQKPGLYLHKIFKVVHSDYFKAQLKEFMATEEMSGMRHDCWSPSKNLNVIEVYWGPTRSHKWGDDDEMAEADAEAPEADETEAAKEKPDDLKLPETLDDTAVPSPYKDALKNTTMAAAPAIPEEAATA